jgi:hypothetical protein
MRKRQRKKAEKREDGVSAAQRVMRTIIERSERDAPKEEEKPKKWRPGQDSDLRPAD